MAIEIARIHLNQLRCRKPFTTLMAPATLACRTSAIQNRAVATTTFRLAGAHLKTVAPRSQLRSRVILHASASPDILDKVKTIVGKQLGVEEDKVQEDSKFVDDLGADSLDAVEMVMALEDEFGVEIGEESAEKLASVKEAADAIAGELAKKS